MEAIKLLKEKAKRFPEKAALIFKGKIITFSQLKDTSFKFGQGLRNLGIKKADRVAIYLPNCPEYIYSYVAVWYAGATCVPLDFMLTEEELISCLSHAEVKILITKPKTNVSLSRLRESCLGLKDIVLCQEKIEGCLSFNGVLEKTQGGELAVEVSDKDYAIIFYTSGTTGRPKGVLINYRQLSAPPESMKFFVDLKEKDITLCALPFSHLGGLIYIQNCIWFGVTVVLPEHFIPLEFLKQVQNYKVTCFWIVPSMYYAVLQLKEFESFDLSSLRWIVTFGASSSAEALRRFHQYCPQAQLLNGWGLTETNAPTTVIPIGSNKIESVGRPAPWIEVKIFDEDDKELPVGQVGEIVVKGWVVTDGYYKDSETTRQAIRNGWFHSGDLGKFDAEGHLYIVGRIKEMIKVAGEIVFEPEVETVIHRHPDVAEVAVIGVPDKLRGEVPKAFIVLKKGRSLPEEDLRYFLRGHLAHFKIPHHFEIRDSLLKNRMGKINKEALRKEGK